MDPATPVGSMLFTVMAALAQMELEIKRERITDSIAKGVAADKVLGGRRQVYSDSRLRTAWEAIEGGEPAAQVARDMGISPRDPVPPAEGRQLSAALMGCGRMASAAPCRGRPQTGRRTS